MLWGKQRCGENNGVGELRVEESEKKKLVWGKRSAPENSSGAPNYPALEIGLELNREDRRYQETMNKRWFIETGETSKAQWARRLAQDQYKAQLDRQVAKLCEKRWNEIWRKEV